MKRWLQGKWKITVLALALLCVGAVTTGVIYHRGHTRRIYLRWKAEGLAESKAGDHRKAVYDLRSYLAVYLDDQEALRAYIYSRPRMNQSGDRHAAAADVIFALRHLITLEPDATADRRALLRVYESVGQDTEAVDVADEFLRTLPNDPEVCAIRASSLVKLEKWEEALPATQKWVELQPSSVDAELAVLTSMSGRRLPTTELVQRVMDRRKGRPEWLTAFYLGVALSLDREQVNAVADGKNATLWLKHAAELPISDPKVVVELANRLDRLGLWDDALALLRKADDVGVMTPVRRSLMQRLWEVGAWDEVVSRAKAGSQLADSEVAGIYGVAFAAKGDGDGAKHMHDLLSSRTDDHMATAWALVLTNPSDIAGLRLLASACYDALDDNADDAPLHFIVGNTSLTLGHTLRAVQELNRAAALSPSWPRPMTRVAEAHLQRSDIDAAVRAGQEGLRRAMRGDVIKDPAAGIVAARVLFAAKDSGREINLEGLTRLVGSVQQALPGEPITLEIQAALLADAGKTPEARAALKRLIDSPWAADEATLLRLAALSRHKQLGLESECYERSRREHGMTPSLAFEMASVRLKSGDRAGAGKLLDDAQQKSSDTDRVPWRITACKFLELAADPAAARKWTKLGDELQDDLTVQRAVLASPAAADPTFRDRTLERIKKLAGENSNEWRLARATVLLTDPKSSADAKKDARPLVEASLTEDPDSATAHWLYGGILDGDKDTDGAMREFRIAADLDPTSARFVQELMPRLEAANEMAELMQRLQCVADGPSPTATILLRLAWLKEQSGARNQAEVCYRRALVLRPGLPAAQNNLAMLLLHDRRSAAVKEAVALATAATKREPNNPMLLDTLAQAQQTDGNIDDAISTISHAVAFAPRNLELRLNQIDWMLKASRVDEAKRALEALERTKPADFQANDDLRARLLLVQDRLKSAS